jgi:hypothetical protein
MDRLRQGTPKTLRQAIENGLADEGREFCLEDRIKEHVTDFIAQKFSVALFEDPCDERLAELYFKITGRKVGQR